MFRDIVSMMENGEVPVNYRDPQEFIYREKRTPESDVYSFGMHIFEKICGKNYFEYSGVPEDECFMMADTDSDDSVISEKYIPADYSFIFPLLKNMTVYKKSLRISAQQAITELKKYNNEAEKSEEDNNPYKIIKDYDYGIILNNKRSGRIEFRVLLDHDGNKTACDIPVYESGTFRIAVSRRHRDFVHITNPSSVFGDKIIPVDIAGIENINAGKIRIYADSVNDELVVSVQESDINGSYTEKKNTVWERVKC